MLAILKQLTPKLFHPRICGARGRTIAWMPTKFDCITLLVITCAAIIVETFDVALFAVHEYLSALIGSSTSFGVRPRKGAVMILGTEDGGSLALEFSKLGFTVFVISRLPATSASSQELSSLLYNWHHLKERSSHSNWGLIAPIIIDPRSKLDRSRAYETVHAYCLEHSLFLVALIDLPCRGVPRQVNDTTATSPSTSATPSEDASKDIFLPNEASLRDVVENDITSPSLIAQDYLSILSRSSGRLIIVSGITGNSWLHFRASTRLRRATSLILRDRLQPLGINVTLITSSPLRRRKTPREAVQESQNYLLRSSWHASDIRRQPRGSDYSDLPWADAESPKESFAWDAYSTTTVEDLISLTKQVLYARAPTFERVLGVYPLATEILDKFPLADKLLSQVWNLAY